MRTTALYFVAWLVFGSTPAPAAPRQPDRHERILRQEITQIERLAQTGNSSDLVKRFTPDAVLVVDETTVARGTDAITRLLRPLDALAVTTCALTVAQAEGRPPRGLTRGTFTVCAGIAGIETFNGQGTYTATWRQNNRQIWQISRLDLQLAR